MKAGIHPNAVAAKILCGCGNVINTLSTKAEVRVDVCSACHPFFTGQQRFIDTEGRVEKFQKRFSRSSYRR